MREREREGRKYKIFDITGEFTVYPPISTTRVQLGTCANPNKLIEGRYFEVSVLYSPKNKWTCLETATKIGPAQADTERESLDDFVKQHS